MWNKHFAERKLYGTPSQRWPENELQVQNQPNLRLDRNIRRKVVEILNHTISNGSGLPLKTRREDWNGSESGLYEPGIFYNSRYEQPYDISGETAVRMCMPGARPDGSFEDSLTNSRLEEQHGNVTDNIDLSASIRFLRKDAKKRSQEVEDLTTPRFLGGQPIQARKEFRNVPFLLSKTN